MQYKISLNDLETVALILNRDCDDDIMDDVRKALDAVCDAAYTIRNREQTPDQQAYDRDLITARSD